MLNIKTATTQVWLHSLFTELCGRNNYAGTTTNLQIVLNTRKNPYLNQATLFSYTQLLSFNDL